MNVSAHIAELERIRQHIAESVMLTPCSEYAAYMKLVGMYEGIGIAIIEARKTETEEEEGG